jgi:hypothetical protein
MKYVLLVIILFIIIVTILSIINRTYSREPFSNNISIINLVLYSNDKEYDKMYDLTKKYYSKFSNVKTIYYSFNENIMNEYELTDDILYIRGKETYIPGILDKTVSAFQYIEKHYDFNYMIRSNISTIVDFDLLTEYLQSHPIQYGGGLKNSITGDKNHPDLENLIYASGTSIIFSKNTLKEFLNKKQYIRKDLIDDVSIGLLMRDYLQNVKQHYIPENRFIFIPDVNGVRSKIVDTIIDKSYIFYRNRQPDRITDVKQMEIIVDYLSM